MTLYPAFKCTFTVRIFWAIYWLVPCITPFPRSEASCAPASVEMLMLEPSDEPILAAISLTALTSNEFGINMPSCPSLSNTESSTGIIDPQYSSEVISTPSRSPCTRAAPTTRVLRGISTPPTFVASSSRNRTLCPSVTVWLPCTHAAMVFFSAASVFPTAVLNP